jgi:putative membrane protein
MKLRSAAYLIWTAGLAAVVLAVAYLGAGEVAAGLAAAGWGLVAVAAFRFLPLAADAYAWKALLPAEHSRGTGPLLWMGLVCEAANGLLPVAHVGGEVLRARMLNRTGVPGAVAGATVVVDITAGVLTEFLFALAGILILVTGGGVEAEGAVVGGVMIFGLLLGGFYLAQRAGLFRFLGRLMERLGNGEGGWLALAGGAGALDGAVEELYGRRGPFSRCLAWRAAGWLLGVGEVWLALRFLGHPVGLGEALVLESLGQAMRSAAFFMPGALGVQEGGYVLLGAAVGLGPETGLELSLVKRVRELLIGIPVLAAWRVLAWREVPGRRVKRA